MSDYGGGGLGDGRVDDDDDDDVTCEDRRLLPFALGYNKAFLCTARWQSVYGEALAPLGRKRARFLGHDCAVLPLGWIAAHFAND